MNPMTYLIFGGLVALLCLTVTITICCCIHDRRWLIQFAKDNKPQQVTKPQPQQVTEEKPWCGNCKHTNKGFKDDPCCYCENFEEWEAQE